MADQIESLLKEQRVLNPDSSFSEKALVGSETLYDEMYRESIEKPEQFWARHAAKEIAWFRGWKQIVEFEPGAIGERDGRYLKYFSGARLNACYNCLDRHVEEGKGEKVAIHWQGEKAEEKRTLTYRELLTEVSRFANVLKAHGVKKGSAVTIYMPMVPEVAVAILACARVGALHSVVFSAFSPDALKSRVNDCQSELLVTADQAFHGGKVNQLKANVDKALVHCPSVKKVLVFQRSGSKPAMTDGRDLFWDEEVRRLQVSDECPAEEMEAEDPLFILYTSGSTGSPKAVLHSTGGYLLYSHMTYKYVFDHREDDIFWCTADVGWITGHSYLVYGPLSNGASVVMFEGVPTYPQPDRFWEIIEQYKITVFYTAPTAIRALMRLGTEWPDKHNLSSLRLLGTVGEPINPEAWIWYYDTIGKRRCPVVDTWWQTETGGIMITTLPGAHRMKPGSAGKPFFGVIAEILKDDGTVAERNEGGSLVIHSAWPGMIRGVYGDAKSELIKNVYFSKFARKYFTGDGCRLDEDGYYWLLGRIDDVINVSAHRFATAEIESALVGHKSVAEAAVVGFPHDIKGQGIYCYVTLKQTFTPSEDLRQQLVKQVRDEISPIATPDRIQFTPALPKTRSGKIMRRILRKIAEGNSQDVGDTSTLADPTVVDALIDGAANDI